MFSLVRSILFVPENQSKGNGGGRKKTTQHHFICDALELHKGFKTKCGLKLPPCKHTCPKPLPLYDFLCWRVTEKSLGLAGSRSCSPHLISMSELPRKKHRSTKRNSHDNVGRLATAMFIAYTHIGSAAAAAAAPAPLLFVPPCDFLFFNLSFPPLLSLAGWLFVCGDVLVSVW